MHKFAFTVALLAASPALADQTPLQFNLAQHAQPTVTRGHNYRVHHNRHNSAVPTHGIAAMVAASARRHGVPVRLALGVAHVESGFRPRWNGVAAGVMQIRPATARSVGCSGRVHDLMQPAYGVECGMRYLALIVRHTNSTRLAAARYTQGAYAKTMSRQGAHYASMVLAFR